MDFSECQSYLGRLGNEVLTMKFGLETIRRLLAQLDTPQSSFRSILVAGTNGKGSVSRFLEAALRSSGLHTGLFTSPHLVRLTERIHVAGREIEPEAFAAAFGRVVSAVASCSPHPHPTFFEMVTACCFEHFRETGVKTAVLEIGMGGRLDSTNVVDPVLSVLTPISLDHQQYLGGTLREIAGEKAGIMRSGKLTLSAPQLPEVTRTLEATAAALGADLRFPKLDGVAAARTPNRRPIFHYRGQDIELGTLGDFQIRNAQLALAAAEQVLDPSEPPPYPLIAKALRETRSPGVLHLIQENPTVLLDGGHNRAAAETLAHFVSRHTSAPRTLVFGMMKDKDIEEVLERLKPSFRRIHLARIDSPRAAGLEMLLGCCPEGIPFHNPWEAYQAALAYGDTVIVAGSFFLAGAILERLGL